MTKNKQETYNEYFKELKLEDINIIDKRRFKQSNVSSLEESIKFNGLINPITVEETYDGKFNLIAGYHRLRAFKALSMEYDGDSFCTIPCKIIKFKKGISSKEIDLSNNIIKREENHVRQTFTPAEMAEDFLELERYYKQRFPSYEEDPVKYIEKYNEKKETKKRLENIIKTENNKHEREIAKQKLIEIQAELQRIIPPSENIKYLFPNATKADIDSAEKIAECEKNNFGFIKKLLDDDINKTTLNKITPKLVQDKNTQFYMDSTKEERKELISKLSNEIKIDKLGLEIEQLHQDVYKIGKIKTHCIAMIDKIHLVPETKYNVTIRVENNNMVPSILSTFNLEYLKVLVIFYDKKFFDTFVESFK